MAKPKYEVVDFISGGFFIHGGRIGETYVKSKDDAELICRALNEVEALKLRRTKARVADALYSLELLQKALDAQE